MAKKRRGLRGIKIEGSWDSNAKIGRGKTCKITGNTPKAGSVVGSDDVEQCADICGNSFFDAANMRGFKSKLGARAYTDGRGGALFVTSERGPSGPRAFTVRHYNSATCSIDKAGPFMAHKTSRSADHAAEVTATAWPRSPLSGPKRRR